MKNKEKPLTSVRIDPKIFEDFKMSIPRTRITIQKLTERSMFLFLTNPEFKKFITNQLSINYTGSI